MVAGTDDFVKVGGFGVEERGHSTGSIRFRVEGLLSCSS